MDPALHSTTQPTLTTAFQTHNNQAEGFAGQSFHHGKRQSLQRVPLSNGQSCCRLSIQPLITRCQHSSAFEADRFLHSAEPLQLTILKIDPEASVLPDRLEHHHRPDLELQHPERSGLVEEPSLTEWCHALTAEQSRHGALRFLQKPLQTVQLTPREVHRAAVAALCQRLKAHPVCIRL